MLLSTVLQFAWANTTDNGARLAVRCAGIAFATVLMFLELGFRNALFDSNVNVIDARISADLVIRSAARNMFSSRQSISNDTLLAARSCVGVASVDPIYLENAASEFRCVGGPLRRIRVLAFDPSRAAFEKFGLASRSAILAEVGTAAADSKSKSFFGIPQDAEELAVSNSKYYELAGKRVQLVGLFENGLDFSNEGNLVMTPNNFAHFFPLRGDGRPLSAVDFGVVRCQTGTNVQEVAARIQQAVGPHLIVETKAAWIQSNRDFWNKNTPIGLVFWFGTILGFMVGMCICYQVFATDISDHISEFSTLKAMGYGPSFFAMLVIAEALLLSLISFVPGTLIALLAFQITNWGTGLDLYLNFSRTSLVLGLTLLMCIFSGLIALRKLLVADPASLF